MGVVLFGDTQLILYQSELTLANYYIMKNI